MRERIIHLKKNLSIATRMMEKHYPAYEALMFGDVEAMANTWYAKYRKVFHRLNKELTELLIQSLR